MKDYQFEICANSVESCLAAQEGGAHRVELCAAIPEGGTTPSYGEIAMARKLLDIKLHVIIRPRGGDFLYTPLEIETMLEDIQLCKQLQVDGVVFGCLQADGHLDVQAMQKLMDASKGLSVTCHRAFDACKDPYRALEELIKLGCDRILSSGQAERAELGIPLLRELECRNQGRIKLLVGCGVNESNINKIAKETGLKEFHFSARENKESLMTFRRKRIPMGNTENIDEFNRAVTTVRRVRNTIAQLQKC